MILYKNDEVALEIETGMKLSGFECLIVFRKPSGNGKDYIYGEWVPDGHNESRIIYRTKPTDLDIIGTWCIQSLVVSPEMHGDWCTFEVRDPLPSTNPVEEEEEEEENGDNGDNGMQ